MADVPYQDRMQPGVSPVDLRLRVVAATLEPGIALARVMALPLDDLQKLVATGYFREARSRGLTQQQIARKLRKSVRTIATLARTASDLRSVLPSSSPIACRRRVVELVAGDRVSDARDVCGRIRDFKPAEVGAAVVQLLDEGILTNNDGELRVAVQHVDLVQEDADHRLESLRQFLGGVTALVYRRFFTNDGNAEAFARVLSFRASRAAIKQLRAESYAALRGNVLDLDAAADDSSDAVQASVVVGFAEQPNDVFWRSGR